MWCVISLLYRPPVKLYPSVKMPVGILAAWYVGRCYTLVTGRPRWDGSPWDHPSPLRTKVSILCFGRYMLALALFVHIVPMWGPMTQSRHKSFTYAKWNPIGNTEPQNGKIVGNFPAGVHCTHFLNNPSAKGALAHLFQHGDNRSYSAGRTNWHLQPIGALEVFTSQSQEQCRGIS